LGFNPFNVQSSVVQAGHNTGSLLFIEETSCYRARTFLKNSFQGVRLEDVAEKLWALEF
jgi:hypothetical protein